MSFIKTKKFNLIYSIYLMVFTVIIGFLFIIQISQIYYNGLENEIIYSRDIVNQYLSQIIIPIILYIISIIIGFIVSIFYNPKKGFTTSYEYKIKQINSLVSQDIINDESYIYINKEKRNRFIFKIVVISINSICALICLLYLFNINNFLSEGNLIEQAINMIKFMLPCILISIISLIITSVYYYFSMKNEYNILKKILPLYRGNNEKKQTKNGKVILITRIAILTVSICFIIIGICSGQMGEVLSKAAKLCTECIGLG